MTRGRFPRWVYRAGGEPDARFTFANERTLLAWIRTALAFIAAGVALELLGLQLHEGLRLAASLVLVVTGTVVPPLAWVSWARAERAMREERPLPASPLGAILAVVMVVIGVLTLLAVVMR